MDVKLTSAALNGPQELTLNPLECLNYIVWYSPATTGYKEERYSLSGHYILLLIL
jgi:hypothetical protein